MHEPMRLKGVVHGLRDPSDTSGTLRSFGPDDVLPEWVYDLVDPSRLEPDTRYEFDDDGDIAAETAETERIAREAAEQADRDEQAEKDRERIAAETAAREKIEAEQREQAEREAAERQRVEDEAAQAADAARAADAQATAEREAAEKAAAEQGDTPATESADGYDETNRDDLYAYAGTREDVEGLTSKSTKPEIIAALRAADAAAADPK